MGIDRSKLTLQCPTDCDIPIKDDNTLQMVRGDSTVFEFSAVDPCDTTQAINLSQVSLVKFSVKKPVTQGQDNTALVIQKNSSRPGEITIERSNGKIYVELLPEDTVGLDPGQYLYDVQLTMRDGKIFTLINREHLQIIEDVTLEGEPLGAQYCPVLTSKGQYMKRTAHDMARVLLNDFKLSPKVQAFTDQQINMFLDISLSDFNSQPTFTDFTWNDLDCKWLGVIARGAFIMGLFSQGLLEQGREFNITDNGISFQPPGLGSYMQTMATTVGQTYQKEKEEIKANMKPAPHYLGTFRTLNILPSFIRLRHLRERAII